MYQETILWTRSRIGTLTASLLVLLIACCTAGARPQTGGGGQSGGTQPAREASPAQEAAAGLGLVCEVYCSKTRTANARIRWKLIPGPELEAARAGDLAAAEQRLETTVYKDGFAKDLYMSWPMSPAGSDRAVHRAVPSESLSNQRQDTLRAYRIRIVEVERPESLELFADGTRETTAVVENLEPGVSYTWRLVVQTDAGKLVSPAVTCKAPVCPADRVKKREP